MAARKKAKHYPGALSVVYLPANQAWAVLWHDQVLRIFNMKSEAEEYASELTYGAKTDAEHEAILRQKYPSAYENPWLAVGAGAGLNKPRRKRKAARKNPVAQVSQPNPWPGPTRRKKHRPELAWQTPAQKRKKAGKKRSGWQGPPARPRDKERARAVAKGWPNPMYAPEKVRTVRLSPYRKGAGPIFTLELWDLHETDEAGRYGVGYVLRLKDPNQSRSRIVFECKERACAVFMHESVDSDGAVASVLSWLTLKPGDTDPEWFENYTFAQRDFADKYAEALAMESINRFGER